MAIELRRALNRYPPPGRDVSSDPQHTAAMTRESIPDQELYRFFLSVQSSAGSHRVYKRILQDIFPFLHVGYNDHSSSFFFESNRFISTD